MAHEMKEKNYNIYDKYANNVLFFKVSNWVWSQHYHIWLHSSQEIGFLLGLTLLLLELVSLMTRASNLYVQLKPIDLNSYFSFLPSIVV